MEKLKKGKTLALVCSLGGHLEQMKCLEPIYSAYDWFLIIPEEKSKTYTRSPGERVYTIADVNEGRGIRNPLVLMLAVLQTLFIFIRERPKAVISTGAGVAIPSFIIAPFFFCRTVYIESFARIRDLSRAGRICYHLSDRFFVQHEELLPFFPHAEYFGPVYEHL